MKTLQQKFTRSKAWRRAARIYFRSQGLTGDVSYLTDILSEIVETMSDNQIRELCTEMLSCTDIKPNERDELLHLLCIK